MRAADVQEMQQAGRAITRLQVRLPRTWAALWE